MLRCRRTVEHEAGDLMHSACIEVFSGIGSLDLSLGGWLGGQLAISITVVAVLPGDVNKAIKELK